MQSLNLYRRIAVYEEMGGQLPEIPTDVTDNLNPGTDGRAARRERDDRLSPQD